MAAALVGCGEMADDGAALQEDAALSAAEDGECAPALDPNRDRGRGFEKRCRHYRHQHRYRRNRAGNARLEVRTLLDANRTALLEVTTGTFDDGSTPPGTLEKLGVDITGLNRKRHDELKFKPRSGGYFSAALGNLVHGQAIRVDATISGIDRGMDRIVVDDVVQYRPDLTVSHIELPRSAPNGLPVSIAATVSEIRGDLGAQADCVLSVDGQVVDRAVDMWVDAGSVVTCHFTHTFGAIGQHAIHVDVGNVRPGDFDVRNNAGDATVMVESAFAFTGDAFDSAYTGSDASEVLDSAGNVLYREDATWSGGMQSASVSGSWGKALTFPLARVSASAASGSSAWSIADVRDVTADSVDPSVGSCAARSDATGFNWITVCTAGTNDDGATSINVSVFAGEVTYHSVGACLQTTSYRDCVAGFTWNNDTSTTLATRHPFGGNLAIDVRVTDAAGVTLEGSPVIPMISYTSQFDVPRSCETHADQMQYCTTHGYREDGMSGAVTP